jgi:hypothetical protein
MQSFERLIYTIHSIWSSGCRRTPPRTPASYCSERRMSFSDRSSSAILVTYAVPGQVISKASVKLVQDRSYIMNEVPQIIFIRR